MRIEITKSVVLDAIQKEPIDRLTTNIWFRMPVAMGKPMDLANCPRCMVGAVLANIVSDLHDVKGAAEAATEIGHVIPETLVNLEDQVLGELRVGHAMNALSLLFEGTCLRYAGQQGKDLEEEDLSHETMSKIRNEVFLFVMTEFPETMEIDIDGATPMEGLPIRILD